MLIRLSRYIILGLIISLVAFLVTQNNKEQIKKETLLLIGLISAVIIFAISFRIEMYENVDVGEVQKPLEEQRAAESIEPEPSTEGSLINERARLKEMAIEMIRNMDSIGTEDDEELIAKVQKAIEEEISRSKMPEGEMAEKIIDRVMNPKLNSENIVQTEPKENQLSMQYEGAIEDVIKEKIRNQLYSNKPIKREKKSDYVIMPVSEWSLPIENRKYQAIAREDKEVCNCAPGQGTGFWEGSFLTLKGSSDLPPAPKK